MSDPDPWVIARVGILTAQPKDMAANGIRLRRPLLLRLAPPLVYLSEETAAKEFFTGDGGHAAPHGGV